MGIVRVTAHPSRYADEDWTDENVNPVEQLSVGKFHLHFNVVKRKSSTQRELAYVVALATGARPVYQRSKQYYQVGDWTVVDNMDFFSVGTGLFDIDECEQNLRALEALNGEGYAPDEEITICFTPDVYDMKLVLNLCNIMEARNGLIVQALGLDEEIRIIVDNDLAFGIPLSAFSLEKIEACIYLLRQASLMAASTGKARMKPCDGSNPKYQMRTWLLRLGFIGDAFARPRQTLLGGLDGDSAFFKDEDKEKAAMKRKAKRMADAGVSVSVTGKAASSTIAI